MKLRHAVLALVVLSTYACDKDKESDGQEAANPSTILTATDLTPVAFAAIDAATLRQVLQAADDLFEIQDGALSLASPEESVQMAVKHRAAQKAHATNDSLRLYVPFNESIAATLSSSSSTDRQKAEVDCASGAETSGYSSAGVPEQLYSITTYNDEHSDLARWNGTDGVTLLQAWADIAAGLIDYRDVFEAKTQNFGSACYDGKVTYFSSTSVYSSSCRITLDDAMATLDCDRTSTSQLLSVEAGGGMSLDQLGTKVNAEYQRERLDGVVKAPGKRYPVAGTKTVTYLNWEGVITFHADAAPTYRFTSGADVVEGTR